MTKRNRFHSASTLLLASALLAGCSSPTPEPKAEPVVTAEPPPAHTADPEASASAPAPSASAVDTAPSTPKPSGRPGVSFSNAEKITNTFGASPSAKLELGTEGATLRIPEYALGEGGVLLTFMIDKKAKKAKGGAGAIYRLQGQIPPAESFATITSKGPAFVLRLPTAKVGSPNLAIGETATDPKGKETLTWRVVAPAKTEEGFATFEITTFTNATLQVTSDAPTS